MATSRSRRNGVRTQSQDTEFIDYSALPEKPTLPAWVIITVALVLVAIVAFFAIAIINERQQTERGIKEYVCGLGYERYTTQWQNCVDDY